MNVCDIKDKEDFVGFLLVRESTIGKTQKGKNYLDLMLADRSGSIEAKVWDWADGEIPPATGSIIKVSGSGNVFNNKIQLRVERWRVSLPSDDVDLGAFVPSAPGDHQAMLEFVKDTVARIADDSIKNIVTELLNEACEGAALLTAPAAMMLHHAQRGGLLYHMTTMLKMAQGVCDVYTFLDKDLLLAGVIIHDLGKLKELKIEETGLASGYSLDGKLIGHLVRGAIDIDRIAGKVGASPEKAMLLQHLVLSHHGKMEFGSPVLPKIPEAEVLSFLDLLDARIFQMQTALDGVADGGFSEKVWALDNRELYKVPGVNCTPTA